MALAQQGGATSGCQGRKAGRTTNALVLADNQELPLARATPQAGNQHDPCKLERVFAAVCDVLEAAELRPEGLFLNADTGFAVTGLRSARAIEVNRPRNRRSTAWQTDDDTLPLPLPPGH